MYDQRAKKNRNVDILNDVFSCTSYTSSDKHSSRGNMDSDNERSCGNLTNVEGIMVDILKHIEKIKTDGNLTKHINSF
jgi:hypothetical protein